ncbi:Transcription factor, contains HOX domain [Ceraceosorus bombacis]|uniref:Transcription factor, contains HOX domain n=1 Tax=Ceraceosorus bombacis TaxID=401625 RepID=A0A0P1BRN9_9BASI|nr:Transcription factor, contains HOX domain [Ceraceosorus bombacis]
MSACSATSAASSVGVASGENLERRVHLPRVASAASSELNVSQAVSQRSEESFSAYLNTSTSSPRSGISDESQESSARLVHSQGDQQGSSRVDSVDQQGSRRGIGRTESNASILNMRIQGTRVAPAIRDGLSDELPALYDGPPSSQSASQQLSMHLSSGCAPDSMIQAQSQQGSEASKRPFARNWSSSSEAMVLGFPAADQGERSKLETARDNAHRQTPMQSPAERAAVESDSYPSAVALHRGPTPPSAAIARNPSSEQMESSTREPSVAGEEEEDDDEDDESCDENDHSVTGKRGPGGSKRRRRTKKAEVDTLAAVYEVTPFPDQTKRNELAAQLHMTVKAVSIWFQNRRQAMKKRAARYGGEDASSLAQSASDRAGGLKPVLPRARPSLDATLLSRPVTTLPGSPGTDDDSTRKESCRALDATDSSQGRAPLRDINDLIANVQGRIVTSTTSLKKAPCEVLSRTTDQSSKTKAKVSLFDGVIGAKKDGAPAHTTEHAASTAACGAGLSRSKQGSLNAKLPPSLIASLRAQGILPASPRRVSPGKRQRSPSDEIWRRMLSSSASSDNGQEEGPKNPDEEEEAAEEDEERTLRRVANRRAAKEQLNDLRAKSTLRPGRLSLTRAMSGSIRPSSNVLTNSAGAFKPRTVSDGRASLSRDLTLSVPGEEKSTTNVEPHPASRISSVQAAPAITLDDPARSSRRRVPSLDYAAGHDRADIPRPLLSTDTNSDARRDLAAGLVGSFSEGVSAKKVPHRKRKPAAQYVVDENGLKWRFVEDQYAPRKRSRFATPYDWKEAQPVVAQRQPLVAPHMDTSSTPRKRSREDGVALKENQLTVLPRSIAATMPSGLGPASALTSHPTLSAGSTLDASRLPSIACLTAVDTLLQTPTLPPLRPPSHALLDGRAKQAALRPARGQEAPQFGKRSNGLAQPSLSIDSLLGARMSTSNVSSRGSQPSGGTFRFEASSTRDPRGTASPSVSPERPIRNIQHPVNQRASLSGFQAPVGTPWGREQLNTVQRGHGLARVASGPLPPVTYANSLGPAKNVAGNNVSMLTESQQDDSGFYGSDKEEGHTRRAVFADKTNSAKAGKGTRAPSRKAAAPLRTARSTLRGLSGSPRKDEGDEQAAQMLLDLAARD